MGGGGNNIDSGLVEKLIPTPSQHLSPVFIKLRTDVNQTSLNALLFSLADGGEITYFYDPPNEQFAVLAQTSPGAIEDVYDSSELVIRAYRTKIPKSTVRGWSDELQKGAREYHRLLQEYETLLGNN